MPAKRRAEAVSGGSSKRRRFDGVVPVGEVDESGWVVAAPARVTR